MVDKKEDNTKKACELCKKEVNEKDGVYVLGGAAFECKQCAGDPKDHEHDKGEDGVCKFC